MTSKFRSLPRVLAPLAVSLLFLLQPQGASFDERRWALCLLPWLVLGGMPGRREESGADRRGAVGEALSTVAVALPVLGLALSFGPGLRSAWLLALGGGLLFLVVFAAERARTGTPRERIAHAAGWLILFPLPLALSVALQFSEASPRTDRVESAIRGTPLALLQAESLAPPSVGFARLPARERDILGRHGAFENLLSAEPETGPSSGLMPVLRQVIPSFLAALVLAALSCCGGRDRAPRETAG